MPYGSRWRARRRLCHEVLNEKLAGSFDAHQYKHTHRFLSHLLEEPGHFMHEVDLCVCTTLSTRYGCLRAYVSLESQSLPGAIILSVTYGIDVKSTENPLLKASLEATHAFAAATVPGKFLVDIIPIRASRCTRTASTSNWRNLGQYGISQAGSRGQGSRLLPTKHVTSSNCLSTLPWNVLRMS